MARSIAPTRPRIPQRPVQEDPGIAVNPIVLWAPPRGMNSAATINRIPANQARTLTNVTLEKGKLAVRPGIQQIGAGGIGIVDVISFTAEGIGNLLRFTQTGAESWDGTSAWTPITGAVWTAPPTAFSFAGWGSKLLVANGVDPIFAIDVIAGTGSFIVGSPIAQHITVFGGRVVASSVYDPGLLRYRIKWSAKNDYTVWTDASLPDTDPANGLAIDKGAGFEDLFSTPGGYIDEVMGVFPITDAIALAVREYTTWQMSLTGDPIAPFNFSRIGFEIGSRSRHGIVSVPDGIIIPTSQNDVVLMNSSNIKSIGEPCREDIFGSIFDPTILRGAYDPNRQEYRLMTGPFVWRYRFTDQGWTRDNYSGLLSSLSFVRYNNLGLTFDQLSSIALPDGTFDELPGTFDELSGSAKDSAMYFVSADGTLVLRENPAFKFDDIGLQPGWELITGVLTADGTQLYKTMIVESQLEYSCPEDIDVTLEYSVDGGMSWNPYSVITLPASITAASLVQSFRKTLEAENPQLRLRGDGLTGLTIFSFAPFLCRGARVRA